jgi:hypothetical protein
LPNQPCFACKNKGNTSGLPLKDKGLPPEITLEIKADSEEGFDRNTLDIKVKETLTQIGAKIEE